MSQRRLIAEYDAIVSPIIGGDKPTPSRVLLGAELAARDGAKLALEGVTHVINCAGIICANHHPASFTYLKLNLQDTAREDISAAFYDSLDFMHSALSSGGTVFVHCQHGVSRSATIVIAYLMWRDGLSYDDALDLVRLARPTINPNIGFACALLQWGASIGAPPTALQAWALQPASSADGALPLTEVSAPGDGATAQRLPSMALRTLIMPPAILPTLLVAAQGSASTEEGCERARADARAELLTRYGCMVFQLCDRAVCWIGDAPPADAMAEAERMHARLVRYHHLAPSAALGVETGGAESPDFWSMLQPPPPAPPVSAAPPEEFDVVTSLVREISMQERGSPQQVPMGDTCGATADVSDRSPRAHCRSPPPMTASRARAAQKRTFMPPPPLSGLPSGSCLSESSNNLSEASEGGGGPPISAFGALPFAVPSIQTPASTDRSCDTQPTDRPLDPHPAAPAGAAGGPQSSGELGEAMAVAALQTVASELLLVLQHEFDLLQQSRPPQPPSSEPPLATRAAAAAGSGGADAGAMGGEETALEPSHLLGVFEEALLSRPASLEECRDLTSTLSQLLAELAPHLMHTPTFAAVADELSGFLQALPDLRGEALHQAEERMLRTIAVATRRAQEHEDGAPGGA